MKETVGPPRLNERKPLAPVETISPPLLSLFPAATLVRCTSSERQARSDTLFARLVAETVLTFRHLSAARTKQILRRPAGLLSNQSPVSLPSHPCSLPTLPSSLSDCSGRRCAFHWKTRMEFCPDRLQCEPRVYAAAVWQRFLDLDLHDRRLLANALRVMESKITLLEKSYQK